MPHASKLGFTLVEVLIAVLVLSVGLFALISSAAVATRMIAQGRGATQVSVLAAQRIELLRSRPCAAIQSGTAYDGRFRVTWTVSVAGGIARRIRVVVASPAGRDVRADTFSTMLPC